MHATSRYNMYGFIHKALRCFMGDTLLRLGRLDVADAATTDATLSQTRELLVMCRLHLEHENRFVHPALEACEPGSATRIASEHVHHEDDVALLLREIDAVTAVRGDLAACAEAVERLYRQMAVFVGDNFLHMDYEEREHNATLWAHYGDAQLREIEAAIVASIPPATTALTMRWMLPALTHAERVALFEGMRANAPAAVVAGVLVIAHEHLEVSEWDKLAASLQLEQAVAA